MPSDDMPIVGAIAPYAASESVWGGDNDDTVDILVFWIEVWTLSDTREVGSSPLTIVCNTPFDMASNAVDANDVSMLDDDDNDIAEAFEINDDNVVVSVDMVVDDTELRYPALTNDVTVVNADIHDVIAVSDMTSSDVKDDCKDDANVSNVDPDGSLEE